MPGTIESQILNSVRGIEGKMPTLRDYFAAKALQGIIASQDVKMIPQTYLHDAENAYTFADAMMKARDE